MPAEPESPREPFIDPPSDPTAKALRVHARLCQTYGCPIRFFGALDPLSELVASLLSHRTRNADSARAYRELKARFADWQAVRAAPLAAVMDAVRACTWPEQKAPRLQAVLRAVGERRGELDLEFLAELPVPEARAWLEGLPGAGPKTSAAVLLFSRLRRPALPVDSHHHRVAVRLGLIPAHTEVCRAHRLLGALTPPDWDAQTVYDHHEVFMLPGQRLCTPRQPGCARCPVLDLWPVRAGPAGGRGRCGRCRGVRHARPGGGRRKGAGR